VDVDLHAGDELILYGRRVDSVRPRRES